MTGSIQVSKKLNDGTILVIAGSSAASFEENAREMIGQSGADELKASFFSLIPASADGFSAATANLNGGLQATPVDYRGNGPEQPNPTYNPTPAAAPRPDAGPPPGQAAPSCVHGPRVFKEGAKNGRAWSGWWCAGPQAEACPKIWNK